LVARPSRLEGVEGVTGSGHEARQRIQPAEARRLEEAPAEATGERLREAEAVALGFADYFMSRRKCAGGCGCCQGVLLGCGPACEFAHFFGLSVLGFCFVFWWGD
jgi:hypothetical protein